MIEHHRGAVEMSNVLLQQFSSGPVAEIARTTVAKQTREISELQSLILNGAPDHLSPNLYQSETAKMHDAMMLTHGADVSETWVRNMIERHRGAVVMSDILLRQEKVPAAIWRTAEATRSDQQKEIHMLELYSKESQVTYCLWHSAMALRLPAAVGERSISQVVVSGLQ